MKKVILLVVIYVFIFSINVYSKYKIEYILECYDLVIEKDKESPRYQVFYSTKNWTNSDVIVKIKFSEKVKSFLDFEYVDGIYQKVCTENESKEFVVEDFAGNPTTVKYEITNIDKTPPIITGIENNTTYTTIKNANFIDKESGVDKVEKIFYGDLLLESKENYYSTKNKNGIDINKNSIQLNIIRAPKNIVKYRYYRIDSVKENYIESNQNNIIYKNDSNKKYKYYVIGIDNNGKLYKSNIIERSGCYFENILVNKNNEMADISISGLDSRITKISYEIKSLENDIKIVDSFLNNNLKFYKKDFKNSNKYKIYLKFYLENKLADEREIFINLNEIYKEEDKNNFSKSGNYDIKVIDKAGNETIYTIIMNLE